MSVTEEDIDNNRLIEEVEGKPLIYNKKLKEYSDIIAKSKAWEEICQQLFQQVWGRLSAKEKTDAGKLVQKRWKNIRTCFARELRDQKQTKSGQAAKKDRRKYKHFDSLLFLLPSMEIRETSGNISNVDNRDDDSDDEVSEEEENTRKRPKKLKSTAVKPQCYEEKLLNILQEKKQANTPTTTDKETHFALSLVPLLKALPEDSKLDIQIEILQIFKREQRRNRDSQILENCQPSTSGVNYKIISQKSRISDPSVYCQPTTSGVKYRIIDQKPKASDARYTVIQPRRASNPQFTHNTIVQSSLSLPATSSQISLPATSSQISQPASSSKISLPATSPQNEDYPNSYSSSLPPPTPSPNSNDSMTLQSYLSNYTDTDESEMYDVCYKL